MEASIEGLRDIAVGERHRDFPASILGGADNRRVRKDPVR